MEGADNASNLVDTIFRDGERIFKLGEADKVAGNGEDEEQVSPSQHRRYPEVQVEGMQLQLLLTVYS